MGGDYLGVEPVRLFPLSNLLVEDTRPIADERIGRGKGERLLNGGKRLIFTPRGQQRLGLVRQHRRVSGLQLRGAPDCLQRVGRTPSRQPRRS